MKHVNQSRTEKESSSKKEAEESKKPQADKLVSMVQGNPHIELFRDEFEKIYARFPIRDHQEIRPCRHSAFKRWLSHEFWEEYDKVPNKEALSNALNVIEGICHAEGEQTELFNRTAWRGSELWYDLTDNDWQAVKITKDGWIIVSEPPIIFRRYTHQKAQVPPSSDGNIKKILEFVNVQKKEHQILMLVWLVSCFIPGFPHPIPIVYGAQGSAKSTLCKLLRNIIDPSKVEVLGFPRTVTELVQHLSHHWCSVYDNASPILPWVSDELCKVVTGGGFSKRELYTDDEDIIYQMQRCVIINGINLVASKPDLLERAILFNLDRVERKNRRSEKELYSAFEKERPKILGGVFDTLVETIRVRSNIKVKNPSRMADFCEWGSAIAIALGYSQEEFLNVYYGNLKTQNNEALYADPIASVILKFMEDQDEWTGTPSNLLTELKRIAEVINVDTKERGFPKVANNLTKRLNQLETNLSEVGIHFERSGGVQRIITIRKTSEITVSTVNTAKQVKPEPSVFDDADDEDGDLPSLSENNMPNWRKSNPEKDKYGTVLGGYPGFEEPVENFNN